MPSPPTPTSRRTGRGVAPPEPTLVADEIAPLAIAVLLIVGLILIARRPHPTTLNEPRQP